MSLTLAEIEAAVAEHGSIRKAAPHLGRDERTIRRYLQKAGRQPGKIPDQVGITIDYEKGEATVVSEPTAAVGGTVEELIRENGLDPDEWAVVSTTLNRWNALGKASKTTGENPVVTLRQVKVSLRRLVDLALVSQATHVPELVMPPTLPLPSISVHEPELVIVESDHHVPYFDPELDAAATRMTAELRPTLHAFLGDGADFPTISKHADHPSQMATVQECLDGLYHLLRRRAEASPASTREWLKGNHDWRLESELLLRAERMHGITPVGEDVPALSIARLCHFDRLGVRMVEHPLGWEHAEIDLVPGPLGLGGRHGWLTGAKVAERSLRKRGRSIMVGHDHSRESHFIWDPSAGVERQAAVIGTMANVRSEVYPQFSVCDSQLQGLATVTRWPDGHFVIEHARWVAGELLWRDRRF